jgi:hypothetical protein
MAESVSVKPELIRWALDRSRLPLEDLTAAFPGLEQWLRDEQDSGPELVKKARRLRCRRR